MNNERFMFAKPEIVKSGLVLWLDGHDFLNAPATTTLRDRSTSLNNGTVSNFGYTAASGSDGNGGIQFDGSNDIINCGHAASFNSTYVTIEARIRMDIAPAISARIVTKELGVDTGSYSFFALTTKFITFYSNNVPLIQSATALTLGVYHTVTVKIDGTNCKIFFDGAENNTAATAATIPVTTDDVCIGNNPISLNRQFNGLIKVVRIYNRALTAAEILQNWSAEKE
jgi:hypothetical protein